MIFLNPSPSLTFAKHINQYDTWVVDIAHLCTKELFIILLQRQHLCHADLPGRAAREKQNQKMPPQTDNQNILLSVWKLENPKNSADFDSIPTAIFQILAKD